MTRHVTAFFPSSRTRLLLLNTFDLAEDSINIDSVFEWIERLNTTFPEQFAAIAHKLEGCDLENELDTVRTPPLQIIKSFVHILNSENILCLWQVVCLKTSTTVMERLVLNPKYVYSLNKLTNRFVPVVKM